ncbi:hypothetical protein E1176_17160 [Fulvivirga sp. RKSG066]|uniref:hypothetical protein n=1 Tax=Fulvivirga aurantia TaxID=2529383 RepID=UPI0012BC9A94|nr:hypothetical protein [Fulvivirga aurantia]MTI22764.1 hypothetical protein [Fulvivirga aurantia]
MNKITLLLFFLTIVSCNSKSNNDSESNKPKWKQVRTESIQYIPQQGDLTKILISTFDTGGELVTDTTIIYQAFKDTLLIEEIKFNLFMGDTTKWRHRVMQYDINGNKIHEIDSVNGTLRGKYSYYFEKGLLTKSNTLGLIPQLEVVNGQMKTNGFDTIQFERFEYYDSGINHKTITVEENKLKSKLTQNVSFDTTYTFHEYDGSNRLQRSISVVDSDTTSISVFEYDESGNEIKFILATESDGFHIIQSKFDELNNKVSETFQDDVMTQRTEFIYENNGRVIQRKIYELDTLANVMNDRMR